MFMASSDWSAVSGVLPILLWILFLVLKKKKQTKTRAPKKRTAKRDGRADEFKRDYDPIEPS
jgi:hypothetical protein